jgi:hypothetical protein
MNGYVGREDNGINTEAPGMHPRLTQDDTHRMTVKDAATLNYNTSIIEAQAIADSNKIIDESLSPEYLTYLFIKGINDGNTETIYIPTEGSLPIIEASRGLSAQSVAAEA